MSDHHGAEQFVVTRRHPIWNLVESRHARGTELVGKCVPDFGRHYATAVYAQALLEQLSKTTTQHAEDDQPWDVDKLPEWIDGEVARRIGARDIDLRVQVLRELAFKARTEAHSLLDESVDALLEALGRQLNEFVDRMSDAVTKLGDGVNTAAAAIDAGTTAAWRKVSDGLSEYRDIRHVQVELYRGAGWPFDREACGDSNRVIDPDAKLYYHRHLPDVAPQWMSDTAVFDSFGQSLADQSMPWPIDPVERMVWCIRNNSGIWCPTTEQVKGAVRAPVPQRNPRPDEPKFQGLARGKSERHLLGPSVVRAFR